MQRGDKRKAYKRDGPWCFAMANPPKNVSVFQFPDTYKRNGDTAYLKKSRKQRKGGSTPNLNKTGRFDQNTIRAFKKFLFFCGENPGKMDKKFGGVAEQALITFLAKADSFGFGSIFDCMKVFLKDRGFNDAANDAVPPYAILVPIAELPVLIWKGELNSPVSESIVNAPPAFVTVIPVPPMNEAVPISGILVTPPNEPLTAIPAEALACNSVILVSLTNIDAVAFVISVSLLLIEAVALVI